MKRRKGLLVHSRHFPPPPFSPSYFLSLFSLSLFPIRHQTTLCTINTQKERRQANETRQKTEDFLLSDKEIKKFKDKSQDKINWSKMGF